MHTFSLLGKKILYKSTFLVLNFCTEYRQSFPQRFCFRILFFFLKGLPTIPTYHFTLLYNDRLVSDVFHRMFSGNAQRRRLVCLTASFATKERTHIHLVVAITRTLLFMFQTLSSTAEFCVLTRSYTYTTCVLLTGCCRSFFCFFFPSKKSHTTAKAADNTPHQHKVLFKKKE